MSCLAPAALSPHKRCLAIHSLHKKCPVSCSPSKWCLTSHSLRQRRPCPLRVCTCAGKDIPMVVDPASSCSPQQCQLAPPVGPAPLAVVFCSLERRAPVPSPSGVSTQPTLVLSLELASRAQVSVPSPCLSISGCAVQGGMQMICAALSLLCPLQSAAVLLGDFEAPPSQLISPSVRWLTRVWVPFLFNSSFSSVLVLY